MSDFDNNPINGTKSKPGLSPARLSSFRPPRDLTLGAGKHVNKKVFTPNLNAVRNKNKSGCSGGSSVDRGGRATRGPRAPRGRGARSGPNVLKAAGVFSEGVAISARTSSRSGYSLSRDHGEGATVTKPILRPKQEWKIDKDMEDLQIKELMKDAASGDFLIDTHFAPTRLPMSIEGTVNLAMLSLKTELKEEPSDAVLIKEEPPETKKPIQVKLEHSKSGEALHVLQNDKSMLLLMQFPDSLPGRGPDSEPQDGKGDVPQQSMLQTENFCTSKHLREGQIGRIVIYKSGKVKMLMGNSQYDLSMGTQPCFRQDVVSVAVQPEQRSGSAVALGALQHKLTATPDWEDMFRQMEAS